MLFSVLAFRFFAIPFQIASCIKDYLNQQGKWD